MAPDPGPAAGDGGTDDGTDGSTDDDQAQELARLRAEVAELRAAARPEHEEVRAGPTRTGRTARWTLSLVLCVLTAVLLIVTVVARYVRSELLDTDRYVETVTPLAQQPEVQDAVATQVTREIVTRLDVEQVAEDALDRLVELGAPDAVAALAGPLADQVESFTRDEVEKVLRSDEFARLWEEANRRAHAQVVAVLTGETGDVVSVDEGTITVDVGLVVSRVRDRLVDRGFGLASNIPDVSSTFTLVESQKLEDAQRYVRLLDRSATILPFVVLLLAAAAVLVSPNRRRGLVTVALAAALSMVLVAAVLALVRAWYLDNATGEVLPPDAAIDIARTLLAPLRLAMRAVLVLALVIALAAFLAGPSAVARGLRSAASRVRAATQARLEGDRAPSAAEAWIGGHKGVLRAVIIGLGVLVLAFWTYPSGAVVLGIVLIVVAALAVVELVGWTRAAVPPSTPAA